MIFINNSICYIVGSCKDSIVAFAPKENDYLIAADGGYDFLTEMNLQPDAVIGDFDSAKAIPIHKHLFRFPKEKDDTDSFLAYKLGCKKGYNNFVIIGGIGGRIDHTYANIQTIVNISKNGGRGFLLSQDTIICAISNSVLNFPETLSGKAGVFAYSNYAEKVTINGLKYNVKDITLSSDTPLGVSNEFIGKKAAVSVENGVLLIIWQEDISEFLENISFYLKR